MSAVVPVPARPAWFHSQACLALCAQQLLKHACVALAAGQGWRTSGQLATVKCSCERVALHLQL